METQKTVGIIRRMDDLGRVVIPTEVRSRLGMEAGCKVEIFSTEDGIFFRKYDGAGGLRNLMELLRAAILEKDQWIDPLQKLMALEKVLSNCQSEEDREGHT